MVAGGSPGKRRPTTSPSRSSSTKLSGKAVPSIKPSPSKTDLLRDDLLIRSDSGYGCEPTSKYGWAGGGANAGGVLQSIKVSEVEEPPPPPPRVFEGPSPEGAPFKEDPSKWGLVPHARDEASHRLRVNTARRWCEMRGRQVRPPPLSNEVEHLIREWFNLVDDDGGGGFDVHKLQRALRTAEIPCTQESLQEMVDIMDFNSSGIVNWEEFHTFVSYKVHAGQDLLNGMLMLPSGLGLPIGSMIHKMRRSIIMDQYFQGGELRKQSVARAQEYLTVAKGAAFEEPKTGTTSPRHISPSRSRSRSTSPRLRGDSRPGSPPKSMLLQSATRASELQSLRAVAATATTKTTATATALPAQASQPSCSRLAVGTPREEGVGADAGAGAAGGRPWGSPLGGQVASGPAVGLSTRWAPDTLATLLGFPPQPVVDLPPRKGSGRNPTAASRSARQPDRQGQGGAEEEAASAGLGVEGLPSSPGSSASVSDDVGSAAQDDAEALALERQQLDVDVALLRSLVLEHAPSPSGAWEGHGSSAGIAAAAGAEPARGATPAAGGDVRARLRSGHATIVMPASPGTLRAASQHLQQIGRSAASPLPRLVAPRYLSHFQPGQSGNGASARSVSPPRIGPRGQAGGGRGSSPSRVPWRPAGHSVHTAPAAPLTAHAPDRAGQPQQSQHQRQQPGQGPSEQGQEGPQAGGQSVEEQAGGYASDGSDAEEDGQEVAQVSGCASDVLESTVLADHGHTSGTLVAWPPLVTSYLQNDKGSGVHTPHTLGDSSKSADPSHSLGLLQFPPSFLLLTASPPSTGPPSPSSPCARPPSSPSFLFHAPPTRLRGPSSAQSNASTMPPVLRSVPRPITPQGNSRSAGPSHGWMGAPQQLYTPAFLSTHLHEHVRPHTAPEPCASPKARAFTSALQHAAQPGSPVGGRPRTSGSLPRPTPATTPPASPGHASRVRTTTRAGTGDSSLTLTGTPVKTSRIVDVGSESPRASWGWDVGSPGSAGGRGSGRARTPGATAPMVFEAPEGFMAPLSPDLCCVGLAAAAFP